MKRRGFLGFAAGAAVAGPGMAKQAIEKAAIELADLQIPGNYPGAPIGLALQSGIGSTIDSAVRAQDILAQIAGMTPFLRAKYKGRTPVNALDPDIASYRSIALHAKIDWQKERNLDSILRERKGWWEKVAAGLDPYASSGNDIF